MATTASHHAPIPPPLKPSLQPSTSANLTPSSGPIRRSARSRPASQNATPAPGTPAGNGRYQPYPQRTASTPAAQTPATAAAPAAAAGTTTPQPQAQYAQVALPPMPMGPNPHIPRPAKQALISTFPSRLRTGTTLLVQPMHLTPSSGPSAGTAAAQSHSHSQAAADVTRGRRGKAINYAELDSFSSEDDEDEDEDEAGSDYAGEGAGAPGTGGAGKTQKKESTELDRSWLGEPPPGRFVGKTPVSIMPVPHISQDAIDKTSTTRECLIPIRVEFDTDTHRIRDSFLWNLYEPHLQPEAFAHQFLTEIDVPQSYADQVVAMIRAQIEDNEGIATFGEDEQEQGEQEEEGPDCRVFLNLDVQISTYHLMDTIEYSLDPTSSDVLPPSLLAHTLACDLSLPPSAKPLIAHALTEELLRRKKDAIDSGVLGGVPQSRARPKEGVGVWREVPPHGWVGGGTPRLEVLSEEELERREGERERAIRRLRRETARQLPVRRRR
ncbi:hypothetical protein CALCODRAFT_492894 [Calocera cornea HHB12733]|uniref:SNF5-domain-containing protein n=1 Tax=Calocera cornea HHB12733 TaxID=1353952 RepID=A0A165I4T7_9BASI|nr:hypothetical protein CALCODRAFT_492894 [Calocera cornea HHB12733]